MTAAKSGHKKFDGYEDVFRRDRFIFGNMQKVRKKKQVQPNLGRIQQIAIEEFDREKANRRDKLKMQQLMEVIHPRRSSSQSRSVELGYRVLEVFDCFVEQINDDVAYVTLKSQFGDVLHGEYSAHELAKRGIFEGRSFRCLTIESNGVVTATIEPLQTVSISASEQRALIERDAKLFSDYWRE